ncbi:hypothetical protein WDU94_001775, partial [Cyamophila willieti]
SASLDSGGSATPTTPTLASSTELDTKQLLTYDVILAVSQAHHSNCEYTEENTRLLVRKPVSLPERSTSCGPIKIKNGFPSVFLFTGFCDLSQDDQLILIKMGFFELWIGYVARLTTDSSLTFSDGTFVTRQQLEVMYDSEFVSTLINFTSSFNSLALNDTEIGLFSAVVLLTPDRSGITDIKTIEQHQDRLMDALKLQIVSNHSSEPAVLSGVLVKIVELKSIGIKHSAHLDWFRENWKKLRLPPLFAEIFDIPKCEEDLQ